MADFTSLLALAEKSGNDVRSCLSMLQFFASIGKPLTIIDVLKSNIGQKDMQKGLFTIWEAIFQVSCSKSKILFSKNSIGFLFQRRFNVPDVR